jgi:NADPH:quinone reductase-like Zn-dependent oxidoreductase/uncharacterized protein YndB with AHSA1/START domain
MLQKVVRSTIIDAPIERVWAVLRDFNSHDRWHGAIDASRIESGLASSQVGCVRAFTLKDGSFIREQLLTLDDQEHRSTYCIVESTVPLQRYVATVTLKPVTDGRRTFWHWESTFATPPGRERELRDMVVQGVYEAGFEHLRRYLREGVDRAVAGSAALPAALPVGCRRVVVRAYGGPEVLQAGQDEARAPGPGDVRIAQRAAGVNFLDVYLRRGWMPPMLPLPGTPGVEGAGTVLDVGEGVTGVLPGDRVAWMGPEGGGYASVVTVPAERVVRLPAAVEDTSAAALLLKGVTADYLLRDLGRVQPGARWLVHAAAGGVGLLLCGWARRLGARVVGTVSTPEKARLARQHGCEDVIVAADYRYADAVRQHFGDGADVIVDGLGDAAFEENFDALAPCGHWISLGQASGPPRPLDPNWLVQKSATFSRPVAFAYVASRARLAERAQRVWDALADGTLKLPPIERHSLEAAARAHERLESRRTAGALVLSI